LLAHRGATAQEVPVGTRISHEGDAVEGVVWRTGRSARVEGYDGGRGGNAELAPAAGGRGAVRAPGAAGGRRWGGRAAGGDGDASPPADTERRMAEFSQLLDAAIANADSRDQLTASRARLLTESDEARRRLVRDLHDGAQQRLVHAIIMLKLAQRALRNGD